MLLIVGNNYKFTQEELQQLDTLYNHVVILDREKYDDKRLIKFIEHEQNNIKRIVINLQKNSTQSLVSTIRHIQIKDIVVISEFLKEQFLKDYIEFDEKNYEMMRNIHYSPLSLYIKLLFDKVFSLLVVILVFPIMLFIAYKIKRESPEGAVFFTQERLGYKGTKFKVLKFRTMVPNAEEVLEQMLQNDDKAKEEYLKYRKLKIDPRIIKGVGHFLRKTSLDELPQFINVLKGDMSVVGPRPYIESEFLNYDDKFKEIILSVKPGVTGYWQVGIRSKSTFNERVEEDVKYITKRTFLLDLKIIWKTVIVVLYKKGV